MIKNFPISVQWININLMAHLKRQQTFGYGGHISSHAPIRTCNVENVWIFLTQDTSNSCVSLIIRPLIQIWSISVNGDMISNKKNKILKVRSDTRRYQKLSPYWQRNFTSCYLIRVHGKMFLFTWLVMHVFIWYMI